nr:MAG TPA: hypothetical protein [Caudoviricetes sp.]
MYSRREKIEHFDRLKGGEYAADDVKLLEQKMPSHPKLYRLKQFPQRYAHDILYALLDVCSAEEIEKNRKPAAGGSSKASTKKGGSSKASTKKDGSSKASTKKDGSSKASTKDEPSSDEGSSNISATETPDDVTPSPDGESPSSEEAKKN